MADSEILASSQGESRSYEDAIVALNKLITPLADMPPRDPVTGMQNWTRHFQSLFTCLKSEYWGDVWCGKWALPTPETFLTIGSNQELAHPILELEEPLSRVKVLHVAGTKGKGSTCAFSERILRESGFNTGLFTSPHLLDVCERFRLNGVEISKDLFTHHFWWCWDRLQASDQKLPGFFRFCTLLGLRMFIAENVDVAILEVGLGGRLDATNVVKSPVACGIASLGYDHMELLGHTLAEIAWEKAGIFKAGVPAFTAPQPEEAMVSLQKRAQELGITLEVARPLDDYGLQNVKLGLGGDHQRVNAALAIALCKQWVMARDPSENITQLQKVLATGKLPDSFVKGLEATKWSGRAEVIHDQTGRLSFYLDGAHSPESMEACAHWFCSTIKSEDGTTLKRGEQNNSSTDDQMWKEGSMVRRVLLFNCMPKRDPLLLMHPLINLCKRNGFPLHTAFFVPPYSSQTAVDVPTHVSAGSTSTDLSWQQMLQRHWESLQPNKLTGASGVASLSQEERHEPHMTLLSELKNVEDQNENKSIVGPTSAVLRSLPAALDFFRNCTSQHPQLRVQVLVTGSLYLVGDLLRLLKH